MVKNGSQVVLESATLTKPRRHRGVHPDAQGVSVAVEATEKENTTVLLDESGCRDVELVQHLNETRVGGTLPKAFAPPR